MRLSHAKREVTVFTINPTPEARALREAGHAVMSYLIRAGLTEKYVPVDRSLILPAFKQVSIEGPSAEWDATTIGLGSFVTVPQVLMAGDAALRIKYNLQEAISRQTSPELDKAWHFLAGYISEVIDERLSIVHPKTDELFGEIYPYVEVQLKRFWACVEVLSTALLVSKTVTEGDAFSLI